MNEGTTCYMNSLLQTLFTIGAVRRAIYNISKSEGIPLCLQRIFYNLQQRKEKRGDAVRTF